MNTHEKMTPRPVSLASNAILFAACAMLATAAPGTETSLGKTPQSHEFKVLLNNGDFSTDRDAAIDAFLDRLEANVE